MRSSLGNGRKKLNKKLAHREVVFDFPKKKKSKSPSSRSSSLGRVLILSSRPNSRDSHDESVKKITPASTTSFYEAPKSRLEKQYELNLSKFLPTRPDEEFQPLELSPRPEETEKAVEAEKDEQPPKEEVETEKEPILAEESEDVVPEMTEELLGQLCMDTPENSAFQISVYVQASGFFIKKAHLSVLDTNDVQGTKLYYSYVHTALRLLVMVVKKFATKLSLELELVICYNIAKILYMETSNLELADTYINRAMSLANRNHLTKTAVACELLYCQILESSNPNLVELYLLGKCASYEQKELRSIADLFKLLRATHMVVSLPSVGQSLLQELTVSKDTDVTIRKISELYLADLHLYRGHPQMSLQILGQLDIGESSIPNPFLAMYHLVQFCALIQCHEREKANEYMLLITKFIATQRADSWRGWKEDGLVELHLKQADSGDLSIPFALHSLNLDEFVIMFYFLSGLHFMSTRSTYRKASKVFTSCLDIILLQLAELTQARQGTRQFSVSLLTGKIVRLNYVRYCVFFYQTWLLFMDKNEFAGMKSIQQFVNNFDEENFTREELLYYKLVIPRYLLLSAVYFQSQGDLAASKFYYMRVRDLSSGKCQKPSEKASFLQRRLGIGCEAIVAANENSEFYMLATLHLVQVTEYEMKLLSVSEDSEAKQKLSASRSLLSDLYSDLSLVCDRTPSDSSGSTGSNHLLELSYKVQSCIYKTKGFSTTDIDATTVRDIEKLMEKSPRGDYITMLATHVLCCLSLNLQLKNEYLAKLKLIHDSDDNSRLLKALLLNEQLTKISQAEKPEQFSLLQTQLGILQEKVQSKIEAAKLSILDTNNA